MLACVGLLFVPNLGLLVGGEIGYALPVFFFWLVYALLCPNWFPKWNTKRNLSADGSLGTISKAELRRLFCLPEELTPTGHSDGAPHPPTAEGMEEGGATGSTKYNTMA